MKNIDNIDFAKIFSDFVTKKNTYPLKQCVRNDDGKLRQLLVQNCIYHSEWVAKISVVCARKEKKQSSK